MRPAASSSAARSSAPTFAHSAAISAAENASLSGVSSSRSNRAVSSISAASPRARTSAMIAATAESTSGASSRFIASSPAKAASKPGSAVDSISGIGISPVPASPYPPRGFASSGPAFTRSEIPRRGPGPGSRPGGPPPKQPSLGMFRRLARRRQVRPRYVAEGQVEAFHLGPDRTVAGERDLDRAGSVLARSPDHIENRENLFPVATVDPLRGDLRDPADDQDRAHPLVGAPARLGRGAVLPAETVHQEGEPAEPRLPAHVGHGQDRVLDEGGQDGHVLRRLGPEPQRPLGRILEAGVPELLVRAHSPRTRSILAPQADSFSSTRS